MLEEVVSIMAVRVREKGLTFTLENECIKDRVYVGDPTRIRQIIFNLCSNAIKFTETGGVHIVITCSHTEQQHVENVSIEVADTGIGIPADKVGNIFNKFTQGDSSTNRKYGGTGLGLAITKNLTEIMGGIVTVASVEGKGSTFTVSLPLPVNPKDS